ncbi:hypothetical protein SAMN04490248_1792 [Salinihabitans flavidus]|uniref:Uncharacterized protein n=1 Tax=Salinihabitans flavidus TaxID=569882 RepID=A0A1H8WMW0_9RHOB|nr:hypothetical protein [Salinihabitans flavidus]SEP28418.1 hypothetical protein SAMN04490248_1792 [Salinihabitans flavidus]
MAFQTDLLGRPPVMRPIPRKEKAQRYQIARSARREDCIEVRVPYVMIGTAGPEGAGRKGVTLPRPPWEREL